LKNYKADLKLVRIWGVLASFSTKH